MTKIYFIGAGSIAEALIEGWITKGAATPNQITVTNRQNKVRLNELKEKYGVNQLQSLEDLHQADLIVLCMKPKDSQEALSTIAPYIRKDAEVLTVLAGIEMKTIESFLGKRSIARAMPNTSATIGLSATGVSFNEGVSSQFKEHIINLLEAVGVVIEVEEDQLHAITALSGSGPAYVYYLLEAFEKAGIEYGLPSDIVRTLMVQTLAGSAEMLKRVKLEPTELRRRVTSPGGTTEAGIRMLEKFDFFTAIASCIRSAEKRSRELAKGI